MEPNTYLGYSESVLCVCADLVSYLKIKFLQLETQIKNVCVCMATYSAGICCVTHLKERFPLVMILH